MNSKKIVIGTFGFARHERTARIFRGALNYAQEHQGLTFRDFSPDDERDMEIGAAPPPWTGRVDGMLMVFGHDEDPTETVDWLLSGGVPVVNVASDFFDPRIPTVIADERECASAASKHLIECGCQRFLHIGIQRTAMQTRLGDLFTSAAQAAGFPVARYDFPRPLMRLSEKEFLSADHTGLPELLRNPPYPVGVWVSSNDEFARQVLNLCLSLGLNIPQDVAIVGIGGTLVGYGHRPTLTSIDTNLKLRGYHAAKLLVDLVHGKRRPRKPVRLPISGLMPRESTGFPSEPEEALALALEMVHQGAFLRLSVNEIAKVLRVDRTTLMRKFLKHLGRSPSEEIRRLRLAHARSLLVHTDYTISEIAQQLGFAEVAAFSNFFYKHEGEYPREYRRAMQDAK